MTVWLVVGVVGAATVGLKGVGPVVLGDRPLPPLVMRALALLAPALLAGLVATSVFDGGRRLVVDARLAGVAVAVVAIRLKAPTLVVIVLAAAVTALVRAAV
jgi:branched-subunit amino acid transport protein